MGQHNLFALVAALALANGFLSPFLPVVLQILLVFYPDFVAVSGPVLVFAAIISTAVLTLLVSGVPAALYERLARRPAGDPAVMWVWVAAAALLLGHALVSRGLV